MLALEASDYGSLEQRGLIRLQIAPIRLNYGWSVELHFTATTTFSEMEMNLIDYIQIKHA